MDTIVDAAALAHPARRATVHGEQPRSATTLPQLLTIATLAECLGITERHVRRLVAERRIPFLKLGHFVRFDPDDVARWMDEKRIPQSSYAP